MALSITKDRKKKVIKVASPTRGDLSKLIPCSSRAFPRRTWRAGGLFCTCSVGDADAG